MIWNPLPFAKHRGKTVPEIALLDPDWFFWAVEKDIFRGFLSIAADESAFRARRVRLPNGMYIWPCYFSDGIFYRFQVLTDGDPTVPGVLDLSIARREVKEVKDASIQLVQCLKENFLGV